MSGNDHGEIVNILNLYALAVDTLQWDLFDLVFTPDVEADYRGGAAWTDLAAFKVDFAAAHAALDTCQHVITNHQVVLNGDQANALSYAHARLVRSTPGRGGLNYWEVGAWYDDVLVRTAAGWRIKSRTCDCNWWDGNPQALDPTPGMIRKREITPMRAPAGAGQIAYIEAVRAKARGG